MKRNRVILGLVLLGIALYLFLSRSNGKENPPSVEYKTAEVQRGDLTIKISATGVVVPNFKVEVKSKASGEVLKFPYEEGDRVGKGELLIQLDKSDEKRNVAKAGADLSSSLAKLKKAETALILQKTKYETDLQQTRSAVEAAEANLQESADKLKRQSDLFNQKIVSEELLDAAKTAEKVNRENLVQARVQLQVAKNAVHDITMKENELELVKAEVTRARIALEEAQERLDETEIFAPITGVIIKKMVEEGQIIASGISNVSGGTPLVDVADMSRLFIIADVDETDIGSIKTNQPVTITADAFHGKTFEGKVTRIAPQGEVENSITIFKVKIEIVGPGKNILKPMMTANIEIVTARARDALYIPRGAVTKEDGQVFVAVLEDGRPKKVQIILGLQNPIYSQVVSGLKLGQKVLLGDWKKLLAAAEKPKDKGSALRKILWMIRSK